MRKWQRRLVESLRLSSGARVDLNRDFDPAATLPDIKKEQAEIFLSEGIQRLAEFQDKFYAQNTYGLLIILQGMDAAGKDGVIRHVMSGLNPQGCQVNSFKAPTAEELDHDFLWRHVCALPARGRIGIFNRSYYEEVLIARVHPEILRKQQLPPGLKTGDLWARRFEEINDFEKYLGGNGIVVLKFFLNLSKAEQKKRFLDRIDMPGKRWKYSSADIRERRFWNAYMSAYEDMLRHTNTQWAPWHVVPADRKWYARLAVAEVIIQTFAGLNPQYPRADAARKKALAEVRRLLERED